MSFSTREGAPPKVAREIVEDVMQKFELPPGYRWQLVRMGSGLAVRHLAPFSFIRWEHLVQGSGTPE
jgi:hypothetical protein